MAVTFATLKKDATIFSELNKNPGWWETFEEDNSLYIEIRKDNQVNVYFEGGSIARIHYCSKHKKLQVFTHHKYLGITEDKPTYPECSSFIGNVINNVLSLVKKNYSQKHSVDGVTPKEKWSEKYIQSELIINSRDIHIDSEFAYNDGVNDIRIDMINVVDGALTFVELKRLDDPRMLKSTEEVPEVVKQMKGYSEFINKYADDILNYYQKVYDIKKHLGLPLPDSYPTSVNKTPQLLIFDRWEKSNNAREKHRERMEGILKRENITYKIISGL